MLVNEGKELIANRLLGISEDPIDTATGYVYVSNGTVDPTLTRTLAQFKTDGTNYQADVTSASYSTGTKKITITGYVPSTQANGLGDITKACSTNDLKMFAVHEFTGITKNTQTEIYFTLEVQLKDSSE